MDVQPIWIGDKMKMGAIPKVIRNMFSKPITTRFPYESNPIPDGYRGEHSFDIDKCKSCGLCSKICPNRAIEMVEVSGKRMPLIHLDSCIFCYVCVENCPRNAIVESTLYELASTSKDELVIRPYESQSASSGGVDG